MYSKVKGGDNMQINKELTNKYYGYYIGLDECFNPFNLSGASATAITFSSGGSIYGGWDWYFKPISFNYEEWRFNKIKEED